MKRRLTNMKVVNKIFCSILSCLTKTQFARRRRKHSSLSTPLHRNFPALTAQVACSLFCPEDGGRKLLRNNGIYLPNSKLSHPRSLQIFLFCFSQPSSRSKLFTSLLVSTKYYNHFMSCCAKTYFGCMYRVCSGPF